jgi:ribosomal protein S27E
MTVQSRKIVFQPVAGNPNKRMRCSRCGRETLIVEYGPLRRSGTVRQKGFFATCPDCPNWTTRITAGGRR